MKTALVLSYILSTLWLIALIYDLIVHDWHMLYGIIISVVGMLSGIFYNNLTKELK